MANFRVNISNQLMTEYKRRKVAACWLGLPPLVNDKFINEKIVFAMTFRETVCHYSPRLHRLSIREKCLEKQGYGVWHEEKNQEQKVFNFDDEAIRFQFFGIKEDSYDLGVNSGQVSWAEIQSSLQHFTNFLSVMSGLYVSQLTEKDSFEAE
jgi:hypothetical protein